MFDGAAVSGGHSTYRLILRQGCDQQRFEAVWKPLEAVGCTYEGASPTYFTVEVPPTADIYEVYRLLEAGEVNGVWGFEEAHVGHHLRRPADLK